MQMSCSHVLVLVEHFADTGDDEEVTYPGHGQAA
jgi:hypothetical protein